MVDVLLDGTLLATRVDLYGLEYLRTRAKDWGQHDLQAGEHVLRIRVVDTNPQSTGIRFASGLDYLELILVNDDLSPLAPPLSGNWANRTSPNPSWIQACARVAGSCAA
jgi:hypothetical protein